MGNKDINLKEEYLEDVVVYCNFKKEITLDGEEIFVPVAYKFQNKDYFGVTTYEPSKQDGITCIKGKFKDLIKLVVNNSNFEGVLLNPGTQDFVVENDIVMEIYREVF